MRPRGKGRRAERKGRDRFQVRERERVSLYGDARFQVKERERDRIDTLFSNFTFSIINFFDSGERARASSKLGRLGSIARERYYSH